MHYIDVEMNASRFRCSQLGYSVSGECRRGPKESLRVQITEINLDTTFVDISEAVCDLCEMDDPARRVQFPYSD